MLLVPGVPTRRSWNHGLVPDGMPTRYRHLAPELAIRTSEQLAGLLWKTD